MGTPPVKVTRSTSGLVSISSAISRGSPVMTDSIGGGSPASYRMSANNRIAESGVFSWASAPSGCSGGDRGHHLLGDLVHRMVERRDGGDHAQQRLAQRVNLARLPCGVSRRKRSARRRQALVGAEISTSATPPAFVAWLSFRRQAHSAVISIAISAAKRADGGGTPRHDLPARSKRVSVAGGPARLARRRAPSSVPLGTVPMHWPVRVVAPRSRSPARRRAPASRGSTVAGIARWGSVISSLVRARGG